jgi:hypothetical protein
MLMSPPPTTFALWAPVLDLWECPEIALTFCEFWRPVTITTWSKVLPQKLVVTQLVKKLPIFYGSLNPIAVFTRAPRVSQMNPVHMITTCSLIHLNYILKHAVVRAYIKYSFRIMSSRQLIFCCKYTFTRFSPEYFAPVFAWNIQEKYLFPSRVQTIVCVHFSVVERPAPNPWNNAHASFHSYYFP